MFVHTLHRIPNSVRSVKLQQNPGKTAYMPEEANKKYRSSKYENDFWFACYGTMFGRIIWAKTLAFDKTTAANNRNYNNNNERKKPRPTNNSKNKNLFRDDKRRRQDQSCSAVSFMNGYKNWLLIVQYKFCFPWTNGKKRANSNWKKIKTTKFNCIKLVQ